MRDRLRNASRERESLPDAGLAAAGAAARGALAAAAADAGAGACAPLAGGATPALAASAARWRPASTILSSGRYSTLLPALLPTYTFVVFE
ncbi:Uncharacterised protein [Burkholderia pseudomallei]|nr:Uncharacterised protein [Burkholderia pseudomallei]